MLSLFNNLFFCCISYATFNSKTTSTLACLCLLFLFFPHILFIDILPVISGFLLAINLSLDDYIISTFTKPSTFDTISTYVFDAYAKGGKSSSVPALRALSTIIFIAMILFVVVRYLISSKMEKKKEGK